MKKNTKEKAEGLKDEVLEIKRIMLKTYELVARLEEKILDMLL